VTSLHWSALVRQTEAAAMAGPEALQRRIVIADRIGTPAVA
jgi:hypothetical protein